jgi:hypothetical protein
MLFRNRVGNPDRLKKDNDMLLVADIKGCPV